MSLPRHMVEETAFGIEEIAMFIRMRAYSMTEADLSRACKEIEKRNNKLKGLANDGGRINPEA